MVLLVRLHLLLLLLLLLRQRNGRGSRRQNSANAEVMRARRTAHLARHQRQFTMCSCGRRAMGGGTQAAPERACTHHFGSNSSNTSSALSPWRGHWLTPSRGEIGARITAYCGRTAIRAFTAVAAPQELRWGRLLGRPHPARAWLLDAPREAPPIRPQPGRRGRIWEEQASASCERMRWWAASPAPAPALEPAPALGGKCRHREAAIARLPHQLRS
jgi:hypothetical protein